MECEAGKQLHVTAPSDKLFTSASAIVREVFNLAPAKLKALGLFGGGLSALPAGYLAADFLESNKNQIINTGVEPDNKTGARIEYTVIESLYWDYMPGGVFYSSSPRLAMYMPRNDGGGANGVANWGATQFNLNNFGYKPTVHKRITSLNYLNDRVAYIEEPATGKKTQKQITWTQSKISFSFGIFAMTARDSTKPGYVSNMSLGGRIYSAQMSQETKIILDFVPCVDKKGVPCMFDKVGKQPFYNSGTGAFIVGMTLAQARKLGKLPAGGGTLTVSLPSNWQEDEGVLNARAEAEAKGWQITVRTYEADAGAAATFALRRIWVRKTQDEYGSYVAADGSRWSVEWCVDVWGADPQELGYEPYRSVDAAVAYWELEPYVNPEEEILTEQ